MIGDMPTMAKSSYASTAYAGDFLGGAGGGGAAGGSGGGGTFFPGTINQLSNVSPTTTTTVARNFVLAAQAQQITPERNIMANKQARRLVQVFIADPDENVPLEKSLLYTGSQKLTDATDQELFFEIDMKHILEGHNEFRKTVINKKVKERTEYLEPVKIRDLKMVVVDVATF